MPHALPRARAAVHERIDYRGRDTQSPAQAAGDWSEF